MFASLKRLTRRALFQSGAAAVAARALPAAPAPAAGALEVGPRLFESIGVRPVINARGTFTILTGSQSLPEVKQAMLEASRHYVHLDELNEAVGKRLAELTGAEWGLVTNGCAAAITHATAACIAGADPEKMQRLPNLTGLKSEVVMPRHSRNVYDHAARMLGVRIVEAVTAEEFEAALGPKAAMVMVYASPAAEQGPLRTEEVCRIANAKRVPVLVDAAAEKLTVPNIYLQKGATLVAYSGGKCLRGPQAAGLLLGRKDLVQAAALNSAPHHAFGRSMKVGKEEVMGMLAAVEMWRKRDHDAEWRAWEASLDKIAKRVTKVDGVTTRVVQPLDLSNHAPQLVIEWDGAVRNITGKEVDRLLFTGTPRIVVAQARGTRQAPQSSVTIMPYMMMPGDDAVVADMIAKHLAAPPRMDVSSRKGSAEVNAAGTWKVRMQYLLGEADHTVTLEQREAELSGTHKGEVTQGSVRGEVDGRQVMFQAGHRYEGTVLNYEFTGTLEGETMSGTVAIGEYGEARWTARRV